MDGEPRTATSAFTQLLSSEVSKHGVNVHINNKAYWRREEREKGGGGYGGGGRGRLYIYRYTVTTRMTPALRWAAMRAILMFH